MSNILIEKTLVQALIFGNREIILVRLMQGWKRQSGNFSRTTQCP
jgi:hypothetical protein